MSLIRPSRCLPAPWIFLQVGDERPRGRVLGLLLEHLAVADDGVQRRAQLVAHVGQELALGPAGFQGLVARRARSLLFARSFSSASIRSVMSKATP